MEFVLFMTAGIGVIAVCMCISSASQELRGIRSVLETHADLVPVKVKAYERRPAHPGDV
tara:strand:+ start:55 stop:231 length:177 start_codon:yes stop_codon:yes gene_type:complete